MRINVSQAAAIAAALEAVNGRATAHTLAAWQVQHLATRAESDLAARGVPIKARRGVRIVYTPAGPGKAYSRKARIVLSTRVTIERGASAWFLVAAERCDLWAAGSESYTIHATEAARDAMLAYALRDVAAA